MIIEISDADKIEFEKEIFEKTQSLWEGKELEESYDAITIDDLNEILKKYLGI